MRITDTLYINENELDETFVRSSGPGGQNVNKVSTAVQLRFNVPYSPSLPEEIRQRLMVIAGHRLTKDGILLINAHTHRTQDQNRQDARLRLRALILKALIPAKDRLPTKVPFSSTLNRLKNKHARSKTKKLRRIGTFENDEE